MKGFDEFSQYFFKNKIQFLGTPSSVQNCHKILILPIECSIIAHNADQMNAFENHLKR